MGTTDLQLDEETVERVKRLAEAHQVTPEELIRELVENAEVAGEAQAEKGREPGEEQEAPVDPFWGLFADIQDVMDQIVEEAMIARERLPFRASDG